MSYKNKTNEVILRNYKEKGLAYTLELCVSLLNSADHRKLSKGQESINEVQGELCETVLQIITLDYIDRNNLTDWICVRGMILKDIVTNNKNHYTEIDMAVFTPQKIYMFECKNYKGYKAFRGKGEIIRSGSHKNFDVYSQHKEHVRLLTQIFNAFILNKDKKSNGYCMGMFDFSQGELEDQRDQIWKDTFPVFDKDNITATYDKFKDGPPVFNMKHVREAVELIEKNKSVRTAKHLDYVTSLDHTRK